jgi:hypothetical protein
MQFKPQPVSWVWLNAYWLKVSWPSFTNFSRVSIFFADVGVVKPDTCNPPIVKEIPLDLHNYASYHERSYGKYAFWD